MRSRVNLVVLVCMLWTGVACNDVRGGSHDVADSSPAETISGNCTALSQQECEASDECEAYLAWPREQACAAPEPLVAPLFMGCAELQMCSAAWTWGHPSDEPENWHMFINNCLPEGWTEKEVGGLICDGELCIGFSLADCESTDHCMPVSGVPLEDGCTFGEDQYAGCWTAETMDNGELALVSCATAETWAHTPGEPEEWYLFPNSCVPDGWVMAEEPPCER